MKLIPATPEAIAKRGIKFARITEREFLEYQKLSAIQRKYFEQILDRKIKGEK